MKKTIVAIFVLMILTLGCVNSSTGQGNTQEQQSLLVQQKVETTETGATKTTDTTPIFETVTIKDENGTAKITKNRITKTAEMEYRFYTEKSDFGDMTIFGTLIICSALQQIIFDPTKFDEWIKEWNQTVDANSINNSNNTTSAGEFNQYLGLEGYTMTNLTVLPIDRDNEKQVGVCTITGKEENQQHIEFYDKYATQYADYLQLNNSDSNANN